MRKGYLIWACKKVGWRQTLKQARSLGRNYAIECGRSQYYVENLNLKSRKRMTFLVVRD